MQTVERSTSGRGSAGPFLDALLRVSLFRKVLLANTVLVFVIATGSTAFAVEQLHAGSWRIAFGHFVLIAIAGAALTLPIYGLILRAAFVPLEILEATAERVEAGDLDARARGSRVADPRMARLTRVFDRLLDHIQGDRERLRGVAARAMDLNETERARIATELEEDVVQSLAFMMIQLAVARRSGAATDDIAERVRDELAQVTDRVRAITRSVRPPALADLGLSAAVNELARASNRPGTSIQVSIERARGVISPDAELAIYRIVQESLRNALDHAGATRIEIASRVLPTHVEVDVVDDGSGFDPRLIDAPTSVGLHGMQERARYAGGSVMIESRPGRGTRVTTVFPTLSSAAQESGTEMAMESMGGLSRPGPLPWKDARTETSRRNQPLAIAASASSDAIVPLT